MGTKSTEAVAPFRCRVVDTIEAVEIDWDGLRTPAGLYQSREWLEACERLAPGPVRFVTAHSAGGVAVAVLPLFLLPASDAGLYHPSFTLAAEDATWIAPARVLVAGPRAGYRTGFSIAREQAGRGAEILLALLAAADEIVDELDADLMTVQYLPRSEAELVVGTGLVDAAEIVLQTCEARFDLAGTSFDDYLAGLSSSRRSVVRRDLAAFETAGFEIERLRLSEAEDFTTRLLVRLHDRHGGLDEESAHAMIANQTASLDDLSVVFAALDPDGAAVAYSLAYVWEDSIYLRFVGLDHDRSEPSGAYFEVAYYAPIRYAYEHGLRTVHLGVGSLRPKVLRGGRLDELYAVFRGPGRRLPASLATASSRRNAAAVGAELGPLLTSAPRSFRAEPGT